METQSVAQRVKEQAAALFSTFCRGLEKVDPAVLIASGAGIGFLAASCGAAGELMNSIELYQAGGWEAVKTAQAQMPGTALEFLAATVQNTHATGAQQLMGVGGLIWSGTGILAAAVGLHHGFNYLKDAIGAKQPSQAEDFRESIKRVQENLDKLNSSGPNSGDQENSFKSRGMR